MNSLGRMVCVKYQVRRPRRNGYVERLQRTLLDEHFRNVGRTNYYESLEEIQIDLDKYLEHYNKERCQQGRNMNGRTPAQAFIDGISFIPDISKIYKPFFNQTFIS